jgi:ankyrin repeat protein
MPKSRSGRLTFVLIVCVCLLIIGRNLHRRYMARALPEAVMRDDVSAVRSLLRWGADPEDGVSLAVSQLAQAKNSERANAEQTACLLIEKSNVLRLHPEQQANYLNDACNAHSLLVLRCLLDNGADVRTGNAKYALDSALSDIQYVRKELSPSEQEQRREISRQMVNLLRERGAPLTLLQAVNLSDQEAAKARLAAGASADEHDTAETTPLSTAAFNGDRKMVKFLLAHGAKVNAFANGSTPLISAIRGKHADIARLLLVRGADPNSGLPQRRSPSTLTTAILRLPILVADLLQHGADVNEGNGEALRTAIRERKLTIVQELLRRGAQVNPAAPANTPQMSFSSGYPMPKPKPFTPLATAVWFAPEYETALLRAGANLNSDKQTALLTAAKNGRTALFSRLLALGAAIDGRDDNGGTALIQCIQNHDSPAVKMLLEHGAQANGPPSSRRKPLDIAAASNDMAGARLLLAHGANVNQHPPDGHTALYYAHTFKRKEMAELLEKAGATDAQ